MTSLPRITTFAWVPDVEGGPNPGHFDAAESGFEHRRSKSQKAAMQLNNRAFWRFTNQASDRRGGLVLLRPVAWIWTALYTEVAEIVDEADGVDEATARGTFNEVVSRYTELAEHMR